MFQSNNSILAFTKRRYSVLLPLIFIGLASACLDPFAPKLKFGTEGILVVDGIINATTKSATVKLSHTLNLDSKEKYPPESGATVQITNSQGQLIELTELSPGQYSIPNIDIDYSERYRLNINTANGKVYRSDEVEILRTPVIDSITTSLSNDKKGLNIYANTHNESTTPQYFVWSYVETYEYETVFKSQFKVVNHVALLRNENELIDRCWKTTPSTNIITATTRGLNTSVIRNALLISIPKGTYKTSVRYSMLLKQRSISEEEYKYFGQLRTTTESLGGLFDPLPSAVIGNMHDVADADAVVLGYFSGSEVSEKRKDIRYEELPEIIKERPGIGLCLEEPTCPMVLPPNTFPGCVKYDEVGSGVLVFGFPDGRGGYTGFTYTTTECGDCRSQGGVTKKPDWW